jgi:hypothetical protein
METNGDYIVLSPVPPYPHFPPQPLLLIVLIVFIDNFTSIFTALNQVREHYLNPCDDFQITRGEDSVRLRAFYLHGSPRLGPVASHRSHGSQELETPGLQADMIDDWSTACYRTSHFLYGIAERLLTMPCKPTLPSNACHIAVCLRHY